MTFRNVFTVLALTRLMQTHEIRSLSQLCYISEVVFKSPCQVDRIVFSLHLCLLMVALLPLLLVLTSSECSFISPLHGVIALGGLWPWPDENNSHRWFSRVTWAAVAVFTYHLCLFDVQYEPSESKSAFFLLFLAHRWYLLFFYSLLIPAYWLGGQSDTVRCLSSAWPCEPLSFIAEENKVFNTAV